MNKSYSAVSKLSKVILGETKFFMVIETVFGQVDNPTGVISLFQ